MDFRQISIGNKSYGSQEILSSEQMEELYGYTVKNVNFDSSELIEDLKKNDKQAEIIRLMMLNLSLNHSVIMS